MLVVLSLIFVADTKITFVYNFVAPLNKYSDKKVSHGYFCLQISWKSILHRTVIGISKPNRSQKMPAIFNTFRFVGFNNWADS